MAYGLLGFLCGSVFVLATWMLVTPAREGACPGACEARGAEFVHNDRYGCVCRKGEVTIEMLDPTVFQPSVLPKSFMIPD